MIRYYDKYGNVITMKEWGRLFEDIGYKRVALYNGLFVTVSTVWLGLNHSFTDDRIIIFETMVFVRGTVDEIYCQRYETLEEAIKGHQEAIDLYWYRVDKVIGRLFARLLRRW